MRTPHALIAVLLCALVTAPAAGAATDPRRAQQWGLDMIHADQAHAVSTGAGVVVAVVDSGAAASHPDLAGRIVAGHDFVDNDATPQDGNGHGTHVTGIIAADAGNGIGIEGVAPGARVMPVRVLDDKGNGSADDVAKGIDWAVTHHADVINLSLGGDALSTIVGDDTQFVAAVDRAVAAGVVVVAAAGNDSLPYCEQPATQGKILCVGAVDRRGLRSFFSSSGDLVAPGGSTAGGSGEDILSTWNDGTYMDLAGTSQATPHVAGVAALLVSLGLHGQKVVDRILATATDAGVPGPDDVYGAGIVNAQAAVAGLGGGSAGGGSAGGGSAGGAGSSRGGSEPRVSYQHTQKIATVLRKGVRVRCHAAAAGRCAVRVTARGRLIARGSASLSSAGGASVAARLTKAGRRLVRGARSVNGVVTADLPGARAAGNLTLVR
jgi:subtilisin family serine protease